MPPRPLARRTLTLTHRGQLQSTSCRIRHDLTQVRDHDRALNVKGRLFQFPPGDAGSIQLYLSCLTSSFFIVRVMNRLPLRLTIPRKRKSRLECFVMRRRIVDDSPTNFAISIFHAQPTASE